MPLEFRCLGCSKLLRTPDESAGKKAKCPQCGTIVDVPLSSEPLDSPSPPTNPPNSFPSINRDPFADLAGPPRPPAKDSFNPYASPGPVSSLTEAKPSTGPLTHQRVSIDEVLNRAWSIFQPQLGQCALFGLVFLAITFGVSMVTGVFRVAAQMANDPAVMALAIVVEQIVGFVVNTFFQLGLTLFALRLARTGEARLNDLFSGGPFYLRGLLATFLFQLMLLGILVLCLGPGLLTILTEEPAIFVTALVVGGLVAMVVIVFTVLRFYLLMVFIVDQNMKVGEAFRASATYMAGNKLTAFLGGLIVSVLGGVVVLCTCMIGSVLVVPFTGLFMATLYLLVTGQSTHSPQSGKPVSTFGSA